MEGTKFIELMLDCVTIADRSLASTTALKLAALEQARQAAEAMAEAVGGDREIARRSFRAEVAAAMATTEGDADRLLNEAYGLSRLPLTAAALSEGTISYRHAQVMIEEISSLTDAERADLEKRAMPAALSMTPRRLARVVRTLRERRAPDCAAERHRVAMLGRHVYLTPERDGMARIASLTPAVDAAAINDRLETTAKALKKAGDPRTLGRSATTSSPTCS